MYFKEKHYRNKKILEFAKGKMCQVNSPVCNYNPETSVMAHSNWAEDDKGMGIKAHDCFVAISCSSCHSWIDESDYPTEAKRDFFHRGMKKTWLMLLREGVLK